jgi:hypothetical protein
VAGDGRRPSGWGWPAFEIKLTAEELGALHKSAAAVQELVTVMAPKLRPAGLVD